LSASSLHLKKDYLKLSSFKVWVWESLRGLGITSQVKSLFTCN
jgi:hypothetical protein